MSFSEQPPTHILELYTLHRRKEFKLQHDNLIAIDNNVSRKYIETGKFVGAITAVLDGENVVFCSPLGLMDRERNKSLKRNTIFRINSMTKPVTSLALMMLYEKGFFQLDDPVYEFIPEFRYIEVFTGGTYKNFKTIPTDRQMTMRDLLSHQSGLTYDFMRQTPVDEAYRKEGLGRNKKMDLRNMVDILSGLPLEFSPGTYWNYSYATDVCGHLIEVISGKSLDVFLREKIFDPLSMEDTDFFVPPSKIDRLAANYLYMGEDKSTMLVDDPLVSDFTELPEFLSGGGGLVSTVDDYLHFCKIFLSEGFIGKERLVNRDTIKLMSTNQLPYSRDLSHCAFGSWSESNFKGVGFGLGFSVLLDTEKQIGHGNSGELAWGGMASTSFWIDPLSDMAVVFMTQMMPSDATNIRDELRAYIYGVSGEYNGT